MHQDSPVSAIIAADSSKLFWSRALTTRHTTRPHSRQWQEIGEKPRASSVKSFARPVKLFTACANGFSGPVKHFTGAVNPFAGPANTFTPTAIVFSGSVRGWTEPVNCLDLPAKHFTEAEKVFTSRANDFSDLARGFPRISQRFEGLAGLHSKPHIQPATK